MIIIQSSVILYITSPAVLCLDTQRNLDKDITKQVGLNGSPRFIVLEWRSVRHAADPDLSSSLFYAVPPEKLQSSTSINTLSLTFK